VRFRILGPLDVTNDSGPIALDAPKQRALLGVLLLHPNETVSSERLIDELWGERPPATATKVLQTYVSQLRRVVGAETIGTRPPGYVLRIDEAMLDATDFRRLVIEARDLTASGDHEGASRLFREALSLWRGPPLADVVFESFARNETERLEEERLAALMDLIDSELALGHHSEVVLELELLVRQHPLRERLREQLMLALYRSGRQANALAVYQDARRTLVEELGIDPGGNLQELERAILTHDPTLDVPRKTAPPAVARLRAHLPLRAVAAVVLATVPVAAVLAFAVESRHSPANALPPNSVGFIDADSGKVTKSFAVGRSPRALEVTKDSIWVANGRDQTVTRIRRVSGEIATIPVGSHPTGIAAHEGMLWVSTVDGSVVPIDPRFDNALSPAKLNLAAYGLRLPRTAGIAAGGGFLWVTVPGAIVVRVNAAEPRQQSVILPGSGTRGPIAFHEGEAWVGGSNDVFPIEGVIPGDPITVGGVRGLTFAEGSLWVLSGGPGHIGGVKQALRRIDTDSRLIQTTIPVGPDPIAVEAAAGAVWVASGSDRTIRRVDPKQERVSDTLRLSSVPTALAADETGIWVTTGR
jgi:DNA-binding SARP family transcriptional activator